MAHGIAPKRAVSRYTQKGGGDGQAAVYCRFVSVSLKRIKGQEEAVTVKHVRDYVNCLKGDTNKRQYRGLFDRT